MADIESGAQQATKRAGKELEDVQEPEPAEVDSKKRKVSEGSADPDSDDKAEGTNGADKKVDTKNGAETKAEEKVVIEVEEEPERSPDAGLLVVCGATHWDLVGRSQLPKGAKAPPPGVTVSNLWGPHVWREKIRVSTIASSCSACHSALITEEGQVMTWGRNEFGQLGQGDTDTRYVPTVVAGVEELNIVQVAIGKNHTLFLTDKGIVYSCGDNKMGQLGQGNKAKNALTPVKIDYKGKPIVKMACGGEFSMILDISGGLYAFGNPEYGQLGHNTDGKFLERAGKVTFNCEYTPRKITSFVEKNRNASTAVKDVIISDIKCGLNHTIALDTSGRIFTWGFAGYGRLGHSETKDEQQPRLIKSLENMKVNVKKIAAGSTFCLASDGNKMLYFWGQTKSAGEATMYPKPLQDLCGWNVRSIGCCNKSIVIAADESLITWGPSPTYGELGYGENRPKSSTTPQEVKPLEGIHVNEVACGFGHLIMIVRDQTAEERARIAKLPKWP